MKIPATGALTGRAVEEWVGKTPDTPVPDRVRLRVFERHNGICYLTGRKIRPGDTWDLEHIHALHAGGEHREGNFAPALTTPHKKKTAEERALKADVEASRKKHLGITKPKKPWPKRTFGGWQKPAREDRTEDN